MKTYSLVFENNNDESNCFLKKKGKVPVFPIHTEVICTCLLVYLIVVEELN